MRSNCVTLRSPHIAFPVRCTCWSGVTHAFPPHVAVWSESSVCVDAVAPQSFHCICVGVVASAWCNTKESGLRVDCIQAAIGAVLHPANIVTDCFCFPARNCWYQHCKVCLTASRRECCRDVFRRAFRVCEFQNEHVLGKPTRIASHD